MSDLQWNVCVTCGVLAYVLILIALCELGVSKAIISPSLSRKIIHIGAASWLIFWPLYAVSTDGKGGSWSWKLNIFVPAAKGVELFLKGAIIRDRRDKDVVSMSRSGNPTELLFGPLQFTLVMIYVGLYHFRKPEACLIMGALGVGDGIAPLVGSRYGKHKFRSPGGVKSIEGSISVLLGTILGYYLYTFATTALPILPVFTVLVGGVLASIVEALAPSNTDNMALPIATHLFYQVWVL